MNATLFNDEPPSCQRLGNILIPNMPVTLSYVIPCGRIIKDATSGKTSFIDTFNIVVIPKDKDETVEFFMVTGRLSGIEAGDATVDIVLQHMDGSVIASQSLSGTNLVAGTVEFDAAFTLVRFTKLGLCYIHIIYNGTPIPDENRNFLYVLKG